MYVKLLGEMCRYSYRNMIYVALDGLCMMCFLQSVHFFLVFAYYTGKFIGKLDIPTKKKYLPRNVPKLWFFWNSHKVTCVADSFNNLCVFVSWKLLFPMDTNNIFFSLLCYALSCEFFVIFSSNIHEELNKCCSYSGK